MLLHGATNLPNTGFRIGAFLRQDSIVAILTQSASRIGDYMYPPCPNRRRRASHRGASNFVDGTGPIFSMYLGTAEEEDKKMAEYWEADGDGILIFVRLYPQFLGFSHANLSVVERFIQFYLANVCRTLLEPNRSTSSPMLSDPLSLYPTKLYHMGEALWFFSFSHGRESTSRSPSHVTVPTNKLASERSLLEASTGFSFCG